MNRTELEALIRNSYKTDADHPWLKSPNYSVFRHGDNKKWFALIMEITEDKLGLKGTAAIDVVNFKCDSMLIGSFLAMPGIFPAYHMSKAHWITVALDGSVSDDTVRALLDMSYESTSSKIR